MIVMHRDEPGRLQLRERAVEKLRSDTAVEAGNHDAHRPPATVRHALEDGVPLRDLELAGRVLERRLDRDRCDLGLGLWLRNLGLGLLFRLCVGGLRLVRVRLDRIGLELRLLGRRSNRPRLGSSAALAVAVRRVVGRSRPLGKNVLARVVDVEVA